MTHLRIGGLTTTMRSMEACNTIVFAPHPDDEALGCAGMIYGELKNRRKVIVVLLTNGDADLDSWEKKHNRKSTYDDMMEYGRIRQRETVSAMDVLGLKEKDILFLGYPDQGLKDILSSERYTEENPFKSGFTGLTTSGYENSYRKNAPYSKRSLIGNLKDILNQHQPKVIFVTHPKDGHKDHRSSGEVVISLAKQMKKPITVYGYYISNAPKISNLKATHKLFYKIAGKLKEFKLDEETMGIKEKCLKRYKTQEYFLEPVMKYYAQKESFWRLI